MRLLALEQFAVTAVHQAGLALPSICERHFRLIILDIMLPDGDGRQLLSKIRLVSDVPIIMLTARGNEGDRIAGLEGGADDYLAKPFNPRELLARMRAVLKRTAKEDLPDVFQISDLNIDRKRRQVLRSGREIALTGAEFDVLLMLARNSGKVLSREQIAEGAMGRPLGPYDRSVDNHISNLRRKLSAPDDRAELFRSVRGTGYVYVADITTRRIS